MSDNKTPVLFIVFNRYDCTKRVFEAIQQYRPNKLYIAADGARPGVAEDMEKCQTVRDMVSNITWPCEVKKLFRDTNLGMKHAVPGAISWFFEQEEEGIILEDDCLPNQSFFHFCQQLLAHYRNDHRIMHIAGTNLQFGNQRGTASYYFSAIPSVWGWAGWRRAWKNYDLQMRLFDAFEKEGNLMEFVFTDPRVAQFALSLSKATYEGKIQTWDFPYAFSVIINNGLCITPNKNLVSNIGFQAGGTNTTNANDVHANIPVETIGELQHPAFFIPNRQADTYQLSLSMPPATTTEQASAGLFNNARKSLRKIFNS
jgi:hypothetical protein